MKAVIVACVTFLVTLIPIALQAPAQSTTNPKPPASVCGHWTVAKTIPTSGVSTAPRKDFLGTEASYLAAGMRFGKLTALDSPRYKTEQQSAREFFKEAYIEPSQLGIKGDSVSIVSVLDAQGNDPIRPGTVLYVRNQTEIITLWDGVYYLLERKGSPCSEAGAKGS